MLSVATELRGEFPDGELKILKTKKKLQSEK